MELASPATLCSRINDSSPRDRPIALGLPSMVNMEAADLNQEIRGRTTKGARKDVSTPRLAGSSSNKVQYLKAPILPSVLFH